MQTKFGKEKKLFKTDSFRVKYGTIDATKLNAIYIDIESWVEPQELLNFDSNIRITRKNILFKLKESLDYDFFSENFIVDLDLRSSGMHLNKKSFKPAFCLYILAINISLIILLYKLPDVILPFLST